MKRIKFEVGHVSVIKTVSFAVGSSSFESLCEMLPSGWPLRPRCSEPWKECNGTTVSEDVLATKTGHDDLLNGASLLDLL